MIPGWARAFRRVAHGWPEHRGKWRLWRFIHRLDRWPPDATIDMIDGRRLQVDLTDVAHFCAYWSGHYEPDTERVFCEWLRPGDLVIDGGANVGFLATLAAKLVQSDGQVHCFEPVPANREKLNRNVGLNALRNVVVNAAALGQETGEAVIHRFTGLSNSQSSLSTLGRPDGTLAKCNVVRLDDYADAHDLTSVRLIKLDVEGAEFSALRGGETLLRRHHPLLLVELN